MVFQNFSILKALQFFTLTFLYASALPLILISSHSVYTCIPLILSLLMSQMDMQSALPFCSTPALEPVSREGSGTLGSPS